MATRNVIIEVKPTPQLTEIAEATAGLGIAAAEPELLMADGALLASAAASAAANLPGVELDPTFGPVQIPRQIEPPDPGLGLSPEAAAEAYGRDQTFDP